MPCCGDCRLTLRQQLQRLAVGWQCNSCCCSLSTDTYLDTCRNPADTHACSLRLTTPRLTPCCMLLRTVQRTGLHAKTTPAPLILYITWQVFMFMCPAVDLGSSCRTTNCCQHQHTVDSHANPCPHPTAHMHAGENSPQMQCGWTVAHPGGSAT